MFLCSLVLPIALGSSQTVREKKKLVKLKYEEQSKNNYNRMGKLFLAP